MPCTSVYDFINGGTIELALLRAPAPTEDTKPVNDGRHGLRPLLTPDADAFALLHDHAKLLAARSAAH